MNEWMRRENLSIGKMRLKTIKGLMKFVKYHLATTTVITILENMMLKPVVANLMRLG